MNICYISSEYPPETGFGGIGTYTKQIAECMAGRGHRVHVICGSGPGKPGDRHENGVHIHRIGAGEYPLPRSKPFFLFRKLCRRLMPHSLVRLAWARESCARARRCEHDGAAFDIVEYPECGAEGFYAAHHFPRRSVARLHTPWETIRRLDGLRERRSDGAVLSYCEISSVRRAARITSPTHALASIIEKTWRVGPIEVIPNPIRCDAYGATKGNAWIYTGRVERRKGVHHLVEAYRSVCASQSPPELILLGRPFGTMENGRPYGDYINDLIGRCGPRGKVTWIEGVEQGLVAGHLAQAAVAWLPSLWENFPYACLEAMASGLCVAASRTGGFPEMITPDVNGLLFDPDESESIASCMRRVLENPRLAASLGAAAFLFVRQHFDSAPIGEKMDEFYQRLLTEQPHVG